MNNTAKVATQPSMESRIADCRHRKCSRARDLRSEFADRITLGIARLTARNPQCAIRNLDRSLPQSMVTKHQRSHCFYDWHCPGKNARIMGPRAASRVLLARTSYRSLFVTIVAVGLNATLK